MSKEFSKVSDLLDTWYSQYDNKQKSAVPNVWKETVSTIRGNGQQLADHSRVVDLKNGMLLVEADHAGWIQFLQMNRTYILRGLKKNMPQLEIRSLSFKLRGEDHTKNREVREPTRAELMAELERKLAPLEEQRKKLEEQEAEEGKIAPQKAEMDENLKALFEKLKKNIQNC